MKKLYSLVIFAVLTLTAAFLTVTSNAEGNYLGLVFDIDDCLTTEEEESLMEKMQQTALKLECNICYCITNDLNGKSPYRYTEDNSYTLFGRGSRSVFLALINTHDKPEYDGVTDDIFVDDGVGEIFTENVVEKKIFPEIYRALDDTAAVSVGTPRQNVYKGSSSAQFYQAGIAFCNALEKAAADHSNIFVIAADFIQENIKSLVVAIIFAAIFTAVTVRKTKKSYYVKKPISAANYLDNRETKVLRQVDRFVNEYTTSYRISSSSSSGGRSSGGGGGGGGHHSSGRHR